MIEFLMVAGAPTPVAPFSHAVAADGWVFVTGQMPTDPGDDNVPLPEGVEAQTRRVVENLKIVLAGAGSALDKVVFARVYLTHFERDYAAGEPHFVVAGDVIDKALERRGAARPAEQPAMHADRHHARPLLALAIEH